MQRGVLTTQGWTQGSLARNLVLTALVWTLGCGGARKPSEVPPVETPARAPARPVDSALTGTIRGVVRTSALPAEGAVEGMAGAATCAVLHAAPVPQQALQAANGLLANAFVRVSSGLETSAFPPAVGDVVLDQVGCLFSPRVLGARTGQTVTFVNSDPLLHNVQAATGLGKRINVALPRPGMRKSVTFLRAEGPIPVRCDVHPWMRAWVFVSDHPCFDTTDAAGAFTLVGVPAGEVVIEAWHETLGRVEARVTVVAGAEALVDFTLPAP